jgi:hypothetical protein
MQIQVDVTVLGLVGVAPGGETPRAEKDLIVENPNSP